MRMKPTFSTAVQTSASGVELRSARQAYPLWEFELTYEVIADETQNVVPDPTKSGFTELQQVAGLFLACRGQYGRFHYLSPEDSSRAGQIIGTGDAATVAFVMKRTWGSGTMGFTEPVGAVNTLLAQKVYLNGVESLPANWAISGNTLTFVTAPGSGVIVTSDFNYYYHCRFIEDISDYEMFFKNLWRLGSCKFRSIKP